MNIEDILRKQHYYIVGKHSGVKVCHWTKESLINDRVCYKEKFYGIYTHRCLQMTPALTQCTQNCSFCWRVGGFSNMLISNPDSPEEILEGAIRGQKVLLSGFKGDSRVDTDKWEEAIKPYHVAISLTGEPTLYPHLDEFIGLCHERGIRTFLVTNGTMPEVLEKLDNLPTQLYVSLDAPNKNIYDKYCIPMIKDGWERVMRTIEILPSLKTRRIVRTTAIKDVNMDFVDEYSELLDISGADFYEAKGYVFVGYSRQRMSIDNMPDHEDVKNFALKVGELQGDYKFADEMPESRVVLMSNGNHPEKIPGIREKMSKGIPSFIEH